MALTIIEQSVMALVNTTARVNITVQDSSGTNFTPYHIKLTVMDLGGNVKFTSEYPVISPVTTRIVNTAVGKFYVNFGDQVVNDETDTPGEWMFDWQIQLVNGGNLTHTIQKVKIISPRTASFMPEFRQMIDKTRKIVDTTNDCYLGYTDGQLLGYLEGGLQTINAYQPSLVLSMENYPMAYKQILLDAGLVTGVMSQQLFSIDSDIPNYNDQGTSFVINHQPQLASFLNQVTQRLDKLIPMMKLQLISSGAVYTQVGASYRLNQVMEAAPNGSIFRNVFFKG